MNANNSNSSNISPAKKRKANDGHAAATDGAHDVSNGTTNDGGGFLSSWFGYFSGRSDVASSGSPSNENLLHQTLSKMDKMEEIMMRMEEKMSRMEEKLATVGSVESRCEQLERKCSSLETILEQEADKALKRHEYNEMLIKNQNWKYSVRVPTADDLVFNGYTEEEAEYLSETAKELKDATTKMRRGEFTSYIDGKDIYMGMSDEYPLFSFEVNNELLPHWKEFALALDQFAPAINILPDNCVSCFILDCVQLNHDALHRIKNALIGKPFKKLAFTNNNNGGGARGGMSVGAILEIVKSNEHLRKLRIDKNLIGREHIERLCSAVHNHPSLVQLDLCNSFELGIGDEMLASLLTIDDLTLEKLIMSLNNITSAVSTLLADFLATDPRLKQLDLCGNNLNDSDAELIANALRSNTTLRYLELDDNNINVAGEEAFRSAFFDKSSLNAAADSNHVCIVYAGSHFDLYSQNSSSDMEKNRARKIYAILSSRNKTMSNVQHFSDIEVKLLPNMLAAVQKYSNDMQSNRHNPKVNPLSVVYEVMRKWDKTIPVYKSLGVDSIEN